LIVTTDIDATVRIDAEGEMTLHAGDVKTVRIGPGDHLVTVVSADRLLRRQVPVRAAAGQRTIVSLNAAGELEEARSEFAVASRDRREADALAARADRYARLPWIAFPATSATVGCGARDDRCLADERPSRSVTVAAFEMMATEVTVAQFTAFTRAHDMVMPPQPEWSTRPDMPAVNVPWAAAAEFCGSLGGRLPSAAEWERAARGAGDPVYPWGDHFVAGAANVSGTAAGDAWPYAAPVASFAPTGAGLFDMIGNVWEWTADLAGGFRVIKGGGWSSPPVAARVSVQGRLAPAAGDETVGWRCARSRS
jgi:formylglycine-generating enzyme required for sulfatase activity